MGPLYLESTMFHPCQPLREATTISHPASNLLPEQPCAAKLVVLAVVAVVIVVVVVWEGVGVIMIRIPATLRVTEAEYL